MIEKEEAINALPLEQDTQPDTVDEVTRASWAERLLPFVIMAGVLAADQLSKYMVETRIPLYGVWAPIPSLEGLFRIVHTSNSGAVFGLFQGTGAFFAVLAIIVVVAIIYFNFTLPAGQWLLRIALGLQLGGAIGNLTDRLRSGGHVTDFIDIGPWYIFNLADLAIVSGVILFGWVMWQENRKLKPAEESAPIPSNELPPADNRESPRVD